MFLIEYFNYKFVNILNFFLITVNITASLLVLTIATTFPQQTTSQAQTYDTSGSSSFVSNNDISEDCAPAAMSRCTDPLKVVTDNRDLGFATSMDELQEMCPYVKSIIMDFFNEFMHIYNISVLNLY
jgi:hypothetical protein